MAIEQEANEINIDNTKAYIAEKGVKQRQEGGRRVKALNIFYRMGIQEILFMNDRKTKRRLSMLFKIEVTAGETENSNKIFEKPTSQKIV